MSLLFGGVEFFHIQFRFLRRSMNFFEKDQLLDGFFQRSGRSRLSTTPVGLYYHLSDKSVSSGDRLYNISRGPLKAGQVLLTYKHEVTNLGISSWLIPLVSFISDFVSIYCFQYRSNSSASTQALFQRFAPYARRSSEEYRLGRRKEFPQLSSLWVISW